MKFAEGTFVGLAGHEIALFYQHIGGATGEAVEIGCMDGFSTAHLLQCTRYHLTSIDPFMPDTTAPYLLGQEQRFRQNIAPWQDRSTLIKDYSWNVVPNWKTPLDFIFIDGDHAYASVLRDYQEWTPLLKIGGVLAMHDSRIGRVDGGGLGGPTQVAHEHVYSKPAHWAILGEAGTLTVARKVA